MQSFFKVQNDVHGTGLNQFKQKIVPPLNSSTRKIHLPIPVGSKEYLTAIERGATKERVSLYVNFESSIMADCEQFLPKAFQAKGHQRLDVQLIPATSWGASLANLLTPTSWTKIRTQVYEKNGRLCELCGKQDPSKVCSHLSQFSEVGAHELWSYHPSAHGRSIQRLVGLMCLCPDCHMMFHIGFANSRGVGEHYANRLAYYNGWGNIEDVANMRRIFNTFEERSKLNWDLDVSYATNYVEKVSVKGPIDPHTKQFNLPKIFGIPYSIGHDRKNIIFENAPDT